MKERLKKTFIDLIRINEVYPDEKEVLEYVKARLDKAGIAWQDDSFRNIIAKLPGTGDPVMINTHVDIPEPAPDVKFEVEGDIVKSDGSNILGADPKTGLAVLLEFLDDIVKQPEAERSPIEAVFTRGEEAGLFGALKLDYSMIDSRTGLVLDQDGPATEAVIQAPAFVRLDADFHGRTVHPREPEKGINALQAAAEAITKIPCGYSCPGVTWNIGLMESGTARNSVPGHARLKAELRSFDTDLVISEGERVDKAFVEAASSHDATVTVDRKLEFEGFKLEQNHPLFERLEKTYASMGLKPRYFPTFGGSDANVFNANGIMCVPIGSGYYNAHEYTEYADLRDMEEIVRFLQAFVKNS